MKGWENNSACILGYLELFKQLSADDVDQNRCVEAYQTLLARDMATPESTPLAPRILRERFHLDQRESLLLMAALAFEMDSGLRNQFRSRYGLTLPTIEYGLLLRYKEALEQGLSARTVTCESEEEEACAKQMFLLTTKPVLYVCNVDDTSAATGNAYVEQVREAIKGEDAQLMIISAQTEADIAELETYEEKQMFLEDLGLKESGCNRLIKAIYSLLNLETFITAGEMEVKAWTYHKGWKAPQCAGVIHTDFEKGFIRAEVIKYADYIKYGSEAAVREAGKLSIEGKDYVVQDGDIMHFRFNV